MEIKEILQTNPYISKPGDKLKIISITDIKLHTSHKRTTPSVGKAFGKSMRTKMPGRIYQQNPKITKTEGEKDTFRFSIPDFISQDERLKKEVKYWNGLGYKVLIDIPKEIPIYAGEDTIEFMNSVNGKRIIRKLNSEKKNID